MVPSAELRVFQPLEAFPPQGPNDSWLLKYGFDSQSPNQVTQDAPPTAKDGALEFRARHKDGTYRFILTVDDGAVLVRCPGLVINDHAHAPILGGHESLGVTAHLERARTE